MKRETIQHPADVSKSAAHWRMRAEEMRTLADDCRDRMVRLIMLRIAADYDRLAKHADGNSDTRDSMMIRMAADYDALADRARYMPHSFMLAQDVILDPETRKSVAVIRNGQVFRADKEGTKIATIIGSYLYALDGNLVGYLHDGHVIDPGTHSMPVAFRSLLETGTLEETRDRNSPAEAKGDGGFGVTALG